MKQTGLISRGTAALAALAVAGLLAGCLATQDDLTNLQERVVRVETQLAELEKENRQARAAFEAEWTRRLASLSEDIINQRERIAGTEGGIQLLTEQIRREAERAERFRASTNQELADFQRGLSARLELLQETQERLARELTEAGRRAETAAASVSELEKQVKASYEFHGQLSDLVAQRDTELLQNIEKANQRMDILIEEVVAESEEVRKTRAAVEEQLAGTQERLTALEAKTAELAGKLADLERDRAAPAADETEE